MSSPFGSYDPLVGGSPMRTNMPGFGNTAFGNALTVPQANYPLSPQPFVNSPAAYASPLPANLAMAPPTPAGMGQALLQAALSQQADEQREMIAIEVHHQRLNRVEDVVDGLARETSMVATDHEMRMRKIEDFLADQINRMKQGMDTDKRS
ncbi:unnamed protein product [Amoebophrya sp. A120]|nr:unnamed protein product [Amoebophrya sp. A120]|eukprot:GSA120T00018924001.1